GLQMPMDATVVGKDRVLIADQNAHQVSERDFAGDVKRQKQVILPVTAQRLPDGHTLVAARNQVVEWDRDRHEVFSVPRNQHDVVAATKARSGEVVLITSNGSCLRIDPKTSREISSFSTGASYLSYG